MTIRIIRGLHNLHSEHRGGVATIGNFDGLHLGHRAVIRQLLNATRPLQSPATLITFEPLPHEYFAGANAVARLSPFRDKILALQNLGIDQCLCLPFNSRLASMQAHDFIDAVLIRGLDIRLLVVGDDFRFGKDRQGDFEMLTLAGKKAGFDVIRTQTFNHNGLRVSSSAIRQALNAGELDRAASLLGRPYSMSGKVIHGDKRGRQLGFPTANISIARRVSPLRGVFAVELDGNGLTKLQGVANIGTRPTIGGKGFLIEAHCLNFSDNLYGKRLTVTMKKKIREEKKFESLEALSLQITQDKETAEQYFKQS